jgi:hypothetical protein
MRLLTRPIAPATADDRIGRRAGEQALARLSDHQLRDIGLTRSEIQAAALGLSTPTRGLESTTAPRGAGRGRFVTSRRILAATVTGIALLFGLAAGAADPAPRLPTVADLPPGTVKVSPPVRGMGEHWANPKDLPLGPIYCVMDGKVICAEFMVLQEAFIRGKSFERLRLGMEGKLPPVDHPEITFMPHGHEGFAVPHYDLHMYFVAPEERFPKQARQ